MFAINKKHWVWRVWFAFLLAGCNVGWAVDIIVIKVYNHITWLLESVRECVFLAQWIKSPTLDNQNLHDVIQRPLPVRWQAWCKVGTQISFATNAEVAIKPQKCALTACFLRWTFLFWLQPTFVHFGVDEDTYVWGTDVLSIHTKYCIVLPRSTDFASVAPFSHLGPERHFQRSSFRICWSKLRADFLPIQTSFPT